MQSGDTDALVYGRYSRAALDREYDNQNKVPGFDFQGFLAHCAAESEAARRRWACFLDIPYGPTAAERIDIFGGNTKVPAPVEVFFHGGYWRMLDKKDFSYVANGLVPNGRIVVVVNYALIPTVDIDELVRQCRAALLWTWRNIADYGGDPAQIHISGHSAGGHIVAMLLATDWPRFEDGLPPNPIRSACAISGIYDLEPIRLCFLNEILQLTPDAVRRNSPVLLRPPVPVPLRAIVGGREGNEYLGQSRALVAAWHGAGHAPEMIVLPDDDHFTTRGQLADPASRMCSLITGLTA